MATPADPNVVAKAFLEHYYKGFATDRAALAAFYKDASTLSFDGENIKTTAAIGLKLKSLVIPEGASRRVCAMEVQPSPHPGGLILYVNGEFQEKRFQQLFQLLPGETPGSFFIHNDIYRSTDAIPQNAPKESGGEVAMQFIKAYYTLFDSTRDQLVSFYKDASMFTFEATKVIGPGPILEKLKAFPAVKHEIKTLDVQSVSGSDVLLVFVTGLFAIEDNPPMIFSQLFQLVTTGTPGGYYVHNDIFKLNLG